MVGSHWKRVAVLAGTVFLLAACVQENPPADEGADNNQDDSGGAVEQTTAENIYNNNCMSCHGQNLEGVSGPGLKEVGAKYSQEEIEEIIMNGKGRMPAIKQLSDENRAVLAEWLAEHK
ncbi:cytochrome c551 [Desmospora activa DSM 45169]|uniref:Cytochrome c551 n=2 Tax=Desmospora TaxID=500614 RepID=A0A2T4Z466_9BACL|nr:cytochrome c551 [Desmospora activa DSM 45169]